MLNIYINNFSNDFINSINERGNKTNNGRLIKEEFIIFRKNIENIYPFNKDDYDDDYLMNIIKNSEGYHMSFLIPPIELLEHIMKDEDKSPIKIMKNSCESCVENIYCLLIKLLNDILEKNIIKDLYI